MSLLRFAPSLPAGQVLLPLKRLLVPYGPDWFQSLTDLDVSKIVLDQPQYKKGRNWMHASDVWKWASERKDLVPLGIREQRALEGSLQLFEPDLDPKLKGDIESQGPDIIFMVCNQTDNAGDWTRTITFFHHRPDVFDEENATFILDARTEDCQNITNDRYIAFLET